MSERKSGPGRRGGFGGRAQPEASERSAPKPGVVTDLAAQAHDRERLNVAIDGAFAFGVDREVALADGLRIGQELDAGRIAALLLADEAARATAAALAFLGYRPRTEREVRDRLRERGFAPETVDAVVARLHGWRYLDDVGFARAWVDRRVEHHPRGRRLLEQELRRKGIDRELARDTLDESDLNEIAAATELARKRAAAYAGDDPATARRRLGGYLQRRGFAYDAVRAALAAALGDGETGFDPDAPPDAT
ncbi:MAG TPA: RecX family transcriptional regulator, partial [Thermomicrobiales bacterium]|nr:RecX family transcriptional regulator [Thermomicrobiales bacterium]